MQHISVLELKKKLEDGESFQLVDVREPWEHELFNIGGMLIPLSSIMDCMEKLGGNGPVVFYCQKGIRSQIAIQRLEQKIHTDNFFNLRGGMDAWIKELQ